jgi:hypothetical protein
VSGSDFVEKVKEWLVRPADVLLDEFEARLELELRGTD